MENNASSNSDNPAPNSNKLVSKSDEPITNADNPGVKFPPPAIFIGFLIVAYIFHHLLPIAYFSTWLRYSGIIFLILGLIVSVSGFREFHEHKTSLVPVRPASTLIETGIFRITRNPLYLGLTLFYIGWSFILSTVWGFLFLPLVIIIMNRSVITKEEAYLTRRFGQSYVDYLKRVRRWL